MKLVLQLILDGGYECGSSYDYTTFEAESSEAAYVELIDSLEAALKQRNERDAIRKAYYEEEGKARSRHKNQRETEEQTRTRFIKKMEFEKSLADVETFMFQGIPIDIYGFIHYHDGWKISHDSISVMTLDEWYQQHEIGR